MSSKPATKARTAELMEELSLQMVAAAGDPELIKKLLQAAKKLGMAEQERKDKRRWSSKNSSLMLSAEIAALLILNRVYSDFEENNTRDEWNHKLRTLSDLIKRQMRLRNWEGGETLRD